MRISTVGDAGDCILLCALLADIPGGPHDLLVHDGENPRGFMHMLPLLAPLINVQPYVKSFDLWNGCSVDWHSEDFRQGFHQLDRSLIASTWAHGQTVLGSRQIITGHAKWLHNVSPDPRTHGRVVIARSPRYHNDSFPWPEILRFYGNILTFIGLPDEHTAFEKQFGTRVQYQPVRDFMEMAGLIDGSELFIGNQSAPNAIAEGLKRPRIQETCLFVPDCIYAGGNVQHVVDGTVTLPGLGDVDKHLTPLRPENLPGDLTLPSGWSYDCGALGLVTGRTLDAVAADAARRLGAPKTAIRQEMARRALATQRKQIINHGAYDLAICALRNSGIDSHPLFG